MGGAVIALVPSASSPGVVYAIHRRSEDGAVTCTCPAATFRPGPCKHVRDLALAMADAVLGKRVVEGKAVRS